MNSYMSAAEFSENFNKKLLKNLNLEKTRQKGLHKQLLSDVVNALAAYCYFLRAERNGYQKRSCFVNCVSLRKAVKIVLEAMLPVTRCHCFVVF